MTNKVLPICTCYHCFSAPTKMSSSEDFNQLVKVEDLPWYSKTFGLATQSAASKVQTANVEKVLNLQSGVLKIIQWCIMTKVFKMLHPTTYTRAFREDRITGLQACPVTAKNFTGAREDLIDLLFPGLSTTSLPINFTFRSAEFIQCGIVHTGASSLNELFATTTTHPLLQLLHCGICCLEKIEHSISDINFKVILDAKVVQEAMQAIINTLSLCANCSNPPSYMAPFSTSSAPKNNLVTPTQIEQSSNKIETLPTTPTRLQSSSQSSIIVTSNTSSNSKHTPVLVFQRPYHTTKHWEGFAVWCLKESTAILQDLRTRLRVFESNECYVGAEHFYIPCYLSTVYEAVKPYMRHEPFVFQVTTRRHTDKSPVPELSKYVEISRIATYRCGLKPDQLVPYLRATLELCQYVNRG